VLLAHVELVADRSGVARQADEVVRGNRHARRLEARAAADPVALAVRAAPALRVRHRLVVRGSAAAGRQDGDGEGEGDPQLWRSSRTRAFLPTLPRR